MNPDPALRRSAGAPAAIGLHLDDLPIDVFDVGAGDLVVESLTGGHGMTETGASCLCPCVCHSFPCCSCLQE